MTEPTFKVDDGLQAEYDAWLTGDEAEWSRLNAVVKVGNIQGLCRDIPHDSVLEIGCGDGSILQRLDEVGFARELYGLEISKAALELTHKRAIPSLVSCESFDGYTLPYEDDRFDVAILFHVLEHLEYPRRMLREAARVAKYVAVEVPLEDNLLLRWNAGRDTFGHINFYNPKTIRRLMQTTGIEIVTHRISNAPLPIYRFTYGWKGVFVYLPKEIAVRIAPRTAPRLITFTSSMLCKQAAPDYELTFGPP